jgi:N-acetylglutamate synthase-like GNAT family acetyltransferase
MAIEIIEKLPEKMQYYALFNTTGWNDNYKLTADELFTTLEKSWLVIGAYENDNLLGSCRIMSDGVYDAIILDLIVHPSYQKKGIGALLMHTVLDKISQTPIREINLFCAQGKAGFYKKFGFKIRDNDAPGMTLKNPLRKPDA